MTHSHDTTPANPIPPGWPDPLQSPQAEAIRNGKLDDTEIRNLFDCMERELRLHRERAVNPAQVTDAWLVTNGPDGQCAKVVVGFENLKHEVVAAVFGDGNDASEEAQDMRDRLDTPGDWEGDRWSMTWSFEDGYLNVQRISDLSVLTAVNPAQVTDAMVEAAAKELLAHGEFSSIPGNNEPNARIAARAALTAAIGAAPKNDASAAIAEMRQTAKELRENAIGDCNAARQAIYWEGKADALEAAIGAGGQEVALPTREEARQAARLLLRCNGADLSEWGGDDLHDDSAQDALKELSR